MNIPLFKPVITNNMKNAALKAMDEDFFVLGKAVDVFEEDFSRYVGTRFAASVSSGTNALQFSLSYHNSRGKEIITTPSSFIATANSIIQAGGKPVFVDVDEETNNIDPSLIEEKITDKTTGILPVHLYGNPCEMDKIKSIARKHSLFVVEDACQAHGASHEGKMAGSMGDAGCFSFYSTKNITVFGDGGMITTDDPELNSYARKIRNCGRVDQNTHDIIGYTSRLNTINAAVGIEQLKMLDELNRKRHEISRIYNEELAKIKGILTPTSNKKGTCSYYTYTIRTEKRDKLMQHLQENGISCGIYYPLPIHLQPVYRKRFGYREGDFPNAERFSGTCLSIPMFPDMSSEEAEYVIKNIKSFHNR